jgi:uncharacterized protein (DUF1501 family)
MGAAALAASALGIRALAAPTKAPGAGAKSGKRRVLVVLLQRGAVDGLSMVVPYADPSYYSLRPTIAIAKPGDGPDASLKLDSTFALHPALSGLMPAWRDGHLAIVHGVGPADETRSHFDAQDYLESGTPGVKATADGWLNRALGLREATGPRAIALAPSSPRILGGPTDTLSFASIDDFKVTGARGFGAGAKTFEEMYAGAVDQAMHTTGKETFSELARIGQIKPDTYPLQNGASYPKSPLGTRMRQISELIQADLGVDAFVTDCGGWDTHFSQGDAKGQLATRLRDFGDSIGAFLADVQGRADEVCLVTATEFGRTAKENGTGGTDHGHGSVMLVAGGNVRGKRVYSDWKGLASKDLFQSRDLAATTDHRAVFSEALAGHLGVTRVDEVFPGFAKPKSLTMFGS